jgi:PAS domain S-box-containing protein
MKNKKSRGLFSSSDSMETSARMKEYIDRIKDLEKQLGELRKVGEALKEGEENFRDIFETVKEGIGYTTLSGKVLSINRNLELILGIPKEKIINKNVTKLAKELLSPKNFSIVLNPIRSILKGKGIDPIQFEYKDRSLEVSVNINARTKRLTGSFRDITESKSINDALSISETLLRRAELASKSGNWELHLDTGIMYGSEGAKIIYGLNESVMEYSKVIQIPLPEYRPLLDKSMKELIENGKPYNIEFKIRKADTGEIVDVHSISEFDSVRRIIFGSIQDITDRKMAEDQIIRKNSDLSILLRITIELLESVERKKVLKTILEGGTNLIGLETGAIYLIEGDELLLETTIPPIPVDFPKDFKRTSLLNHPNISKAVNENRPVLIPDVSLAEFTAEERLIAKTRSLGSILYIPLYARMRVAGVLIIGSVNRLHSFTESDIALSQTLSNLASLSLENSFLFEDMTVAKEKAEESDRLKTAFIQNISHEIRTPLNAIIGFSGFLEQPDLSEADRKEYINIIFQSNNQLLSIINDILNISQIETGQVTLKYNDVNINLIIRNLYLQFHLEAEKKNIELRTKTVFPDEISILLTDKDKLIQIISNLLSNAIKFTNEGYVEFGYYYNGDNLIFFIKDSGIGISENEQFRIFERFYQVDKAVSRRYGGTGLGLSISKAYAELLGGKLWVESVLGAGSTFYCSIPYKKGKYEANCTNPNTDFVIESQHSSSKILVAEDDDFSYSLLYAIFKPLGYEIVRAIDGRSAIELCKSDKDIALVLMDIKMPVVDGYEATYEIKKFRPEIKVIVQTACAHPADRTRAFEKGCDEYFVKPFNRKLIVSIVEKYLR